MTRGSLTLSRLTGPPARALAPRLALCLLPLLASCVTETVRPGDGRVFKPPEPLDTLLWSAGVFHGVELLFELDPQGDLGLAEGETGYLSMWYPSFIGSTQVYRSPGNVHELTYAQDRFEVGPYRYPSESGAKLFVFKARTGPIEFWFHDQRIRVQASGSWKPSIWWHWTVHRDERNVSWLEETLRIGLATIEVSSKESLWTVEGRRFVPDANKVLELEGAVEFEG